MRKVYLDDAAVTHLLPEVCEAILPYLEEDFDNPSCLHEWRDTVREEIAITPCAVATGLEGLPKNKFQCSNLGAQALNKAIKDYQNNKAT